MKRQLWGKDKWHERFDRDPNLSETILEYHHAVLERAKQYLKNNLTEDELKRNARSLTLKDADTVRGRLLGILSEGFQHVGQAAYFRGLLKGAGWLGR